MPKLNPQTHIDRATQSLEEALLQVQSPNFKMLTDQEVDALKKMQLQVRHLRNSHIRLLYTAGVSNKELAAMYHLTSARISQICAELCLA